MNLSLTTLQFGSFRSFEMLPCCCLNGARRSTRACGYLKTSLSVCSCKFLRFYSSIFNTVLGIWLDMIWKSSTVFISCHVWRKAGRVEHSTMPTVEHSHGNIMLWGCWSAAETGRLVRIDRKMNAAMYRKLLDENLLHRTQDLRLRWGFDQRGSGFRTTQQISLRGATRSQTWIWSTIPVIVSSSWACL